MIYITGDTHGINNFDKLLSLELSQLTKNDYVIICGDCGVLFSPKTAEDMIRQYSNLPFTVLYVDGNHENFDLLNSYPVIEWNGGKVHKISDSVYHLMRGQVFEIENKTFFTFGGGLSVDKIWRVEGRSWWREEMPSGQEFDDGMRNLERYDYTVDYVISHDCPEFLMRPLSKYPTAFRLG